jgi:hypothetical protein
MNGQCMELKVCEGCGALWLRAALAAGVYCRVCTLKLSEFPAVQRRHVQVRKASQAGPVLVAGGAR